MKHDLPIPSRGMLNLLAFMIAIAIFLTIFALSVNSYLGDSSDTEYETPSTPLIVPDPETCLAPETVEEVNTKVKKP